MILSRPLIMLVALAIVASAPSPTRAQQVGINAAIRNVVRTKTARDAALRPAVLREKVSLGDDIVTGAGAVDQLLLLDGSVFTIGSNGQVRIDRFVYDPARSASAIGAAVLKGAFRFMSARSTHALPGQSAIRTPVGVIGIRGTIVEGAIGADAVRIASGEAAVGAAADAADPVNATLVVLRGPGAATKGGEYSGAVDVPNQTQTTALDRPGLALFIPAVNAPAIGPFLISDAGLDQLRALLRSTVQNNGQSNAQQQRRGTVEVLNDCAVTVVDTISVQGGQTDIPTTQSTGGCGG